MTKTYRGITELYGRVILLSAEGASVNTHSGDRIEIAPECKDFADLRVGRTYGFQGEAHWCLDSDRVVSFDAKRLGPYRDRDHPDDPRPRTNAEAMDNLAKASGDRWDNIDPDEWLRELRSDD